MPKLSSEQTHHLAHRHGPQVVREMERHMEDPRLSDALANSIGVTRRQLERLFATHLKDTPSYFSQAYRSRLHSPPKQDRLAR